VSGEVQHRRLGDIYYVLGVLLGEQNHADESLQALRQAAAHSPHDLRIRRDLASELIRRQAHDEAAEQLELALDIQPHDLGLRRLLGMVRFRQREFDDAIELFSEVLKTQPTDAASRWNLANSYRGSGDYGSAVAQYRKMLRQQPGNPMAANNLAWILSTHRQPALRNGAEAVSIAEPLIKTTKGQDPNAWDTLAAAYAEVGRFADAEAAVEKAIQLATEREELAAAAAMKDRLRGYQSMRPHREQ
jgi:Flp pilus assembly protein TadD